MFVCLVLSLLCGCETLAYLAQAASGQATIIAASAPLEQVIEDPDTAPALRARLELVLALRDFAAKELAMGELRGFESYAALDRTYVVWNVVAAPEFDVDAVSWCFPIAGCVRYRGYFDRAAGERFASRLRREGYDTDLYGVAAYSTLGWFRDPVLDTWITRSESSLVGLVFHELAHQRLYVAGDTELSESFARVVEREGVRRWFEATGREAEYGRYLERIRVDSEFAALIESSRRRLVELYAEPISDALKRERKAGVFEQLRAEYRDISASWPQEYRFDQWMARPLNNARLAGMANYTRWVDALGRLLDACDGDLGRFYARVAELAELTAGQRESQLKRF
jgi:predicted aminopeptidase